MRTSTLLSLVGACLLLIGTAMAADTHPVSPKSKLAQASPGSSTRVALVIGNSSYPRDPLPFTINDATDMAQALSELGFEVTVATNVNLTQMTELTSSFVQKAKSAHVALFYFAGHGERYVQGDVEENFLLPVNVVPGQGQGNFRNSIGVKARLLTHLATSVENRISILILDACRTQSVTRHQGTERQIPSLYHGGLARMELPSGTFVAYGAAPGTAAIEEQDSKHGRFTQSILRYIHTPKLTLEQVFKRVRSDVEQASGVKQSPREESSLRGDQDFYFVDPAQGHGRITRYTWSSLENATPIPPSTEKLSVLDSIRTTPASSRVHALRELIETRPLNLSVSDAEKVLSYFWPRVRRRVLETMAPQLPASMSVTDVARLIQQSDLVSRVGGISDPKHPELMNRSPFDQKPLKDIFRLLQSLGKIAFKIQYPQLEDALRSSPSVDRCANVQDQGLNPPGTNLSAQGERPRDVSANRQLLEFARDRQIGFDQNRQRIMTLFQSHRIELSVTEVTEILRAYPEEVREEVVRKDIEGGLPDYLTWTELAELLKVFERKERGQHYENEPNISRPRQTMFDYFNARGMVDANMTLEEGLVIKELFQQETSELGRHMRGFVAKQMESAPREPSVPQEVWERRMEIMNHQMQSQEGQTAMRRIWSQGAEMQLIEFLACNQRNSESIQKLAS